MGVRWIIAGCLCVVGITGGWGLLARAAPPLVPYVTAIKAGSTEEMALVQRNEGSTLVDSVRRAEAGQFWVYALPVAPDEACLLELTPADAAETTLPNVTVAGADGKPLPARVERGAMGVLQIAWTVPGTWPVGAKMSVVIGSPAAAVTVKSLRFVERQADANGTGLPENVARLMLEGTPPGTRVNVSGTPANPYTVTQTGHLPEPGLDLQTDAVFAYGTGEDLIQGWKSRNYTVWTMGGSREGKTYADAHPEELQTAANGRPITIGGDSYYLHPTPNRNSVERAYYELALSRGSEGVCPEEPEYFAYAGYEAAFKAAWKQKYGTEWQPPESGVDARWKASQLMAQLETEHIASVLQATQSKPGVRRMVGLHSPLHYALSGVVSPQYRITNLPGVQDVIGQVWTGTARTPVRYEGQRADHTFSTAFLEYSSLYHLTRGTARRLWFVLDPLEDDPTRSLADYKSHYEQTLIAALLFPGVDAYEVMPWPERVYGHIPPDYAAEVQTLTAALQEMHNQQGIEGNAVNAGIGVFASDAMQYQRAAPNISDLDGFFGLALPLLQRGVAIQVLSLDRAAEPGYLNGFKTLLLSYDYQKPPDMRAQMALAEWVRGGGSLLFFGGSDAYNAVADSWWKQAHLAAPQDSLFARLGIATGGPAHTKAGPAEDLRAYTRILQAETDSHDLKNRRAYTLDLTPYAQKTGSLRVRFLDRSPQDGWGPWVKGAELRVGGQIAAAFATGSEIENHFLAYDNGSLVNGGARFADGGASWTYQFDNLPRGVPITLTVDMGNGFRVEAASVQPEFGHALLSTDAVGGLAKVFPRLRIGAAYPATLYPVTASPSTRKSSGKGGAGKPEAEGLTILYTLRSGGAPVWMQPVGRGRLIYVGVAPGYFSASETSAGLLRGLVQYAHQRAGGTYAEPGFLRLRRGRFHIVRTFGDEEEIEGRTIDLLSPTLAVAEDRTIPPRSLALLYDIGPDGEPPHIGFVSGRVQARLEMPRLTEFFVRAPLNTPGVARLHAGGRLVAGARAMDRLGRPITLQFDKEGDTLLLRYPNDPDGVIVRVGWN